MDVNEIFNHVLSSLTEPMRTADNLMKKRLTLADGGLTIVLASIIPAVIFALFALTFIGMMGRMMGTVPMMGWVPAVSAGISSLTAVTILVLFPIITLIHWLLDSILLWLIGSALGGKGDFSRFAGALAFPMAAVVALMWIPLINVLAWLYAVYVFYVFLQSTMKLSKNNAALTVIMAFVVWLFLWTSFGWTYMWGMGWY